MRDESLHGILRVHEGQTPEDESVVRRPTPTTVGQTPVVALDALVQAVLDGRRPEVVSHVGTSETATPSRGPTLGLVS